MVKVAYGVFQRPKIGYTVSGDAYLVKEDAGDTLVCLVDGLGSGPAAAEAAQTAIDWAAAHHRAPLSQVVAGCHEAMRYTRGAAMALLRINAERQALSFVGVGNIGFHAWSAEPMQPISYAGIVGSRLPSLHEFVFDLTPGDLIIIHTDGISRRFALDGAVERATVNSPQCLAEAIAQDYAKQNDDVTLIVLTLASNSNVNYQQCGSNI